MTLARKWILKASTVKAVRAAQALQISPSPPRPFLVFHRKTVWTQSVVPRAEEMRSLQEHQIVFLMYCRRTPTSSFVPCVDWR